MTDNNEELKPCPFCGGESSVCNGSIKEPATIKCVECGAIMDGTMYETDNNLVSWHGDADKKWNTRADQASKGVDVEGLENKIKNIKASYSNFGLELKCGIDGNTTLDYGRVQGMEIAIEYLNSQGHLAPAIPNKKLEEDKNG